MRLSSRQRPDGRKLAYFSLEYFQDCLQMGELCCRKFLKLNGTGPWNTSYIRPSGNICFQVRNYSVKGPYWKSLVYPNFTKFSKDADYVFMLMFNFDGQIKFYFSYLFLLEKKKSIFFTSKKYIFKRVFFLKILHFFLNKKDFFFEKS